MKNLLLLLMTVMVVSYYHNYEKYTGAFKKLNTDSTGVMLGDTASINKIYQ